MDFVAVVFPSPLLLDCDEEERLAEEESSSSFGGPPPRKLSIVKKPEIDFVRLQIHWRAADDFCKPEQIVHAEIHYKQHQEHAARSDAWGTEGRVESLRVFKMDADEELIKIVKNKRARFVEVRNLVPDCTYSFAVKFLYRQDVKGGGGLSRLSEKIKVKLPRAILTCGICGATLNWGLEACPQCHGDANVTAI